MAPDAKETARVQIVEELQAGGYGNREIVVRYGCCPASVQQPRSVVVVAAVRLMRNVRADCSRERLQSKRAVHGVV